MRRISILFINLMLLLFSVVPVSLQAQKQTDPKVVPVTTAQWKLNQALLEAVKQGKLSVIKTRLTKGADVNALEEDNNGFSPLMYAAGGDGKILTYLLDHGANIDLQTKNGITALMEAADHLSLNNVKMLLSRGARRDIKTPQGYTVLNLAVWCWGLIGAHGERFDERVYNDIVELLALGDTICVDSETGVKIICKVHQAIFPLAWTYPPLSAKADSLDTSESDRYTQTLRKEFKKYPSAMLRQFLNKIYIVKNLSFKDTRVGGFSWPNAKILYLSADPGATGIFLAHTLHHEFTHLLIQSHATRFSNSDWERLNPPGFQYSNDTYEGIRAGKYSPYISDLFIWQKGFASSYGMSSLDEDIATVSQAIFCGDIKFWQAVDQYPILKKKVDRIIAFYYALDKTFTLDYFRHLPPISTTL